MTIAERQRRSSLSGTAPSRPISGTSRWSDLGWPAILFLVALLQPSKTSFNVGDLRLTIYRLVLLATIIPCMAAVFSKACGKVRACDYLMILHALCVAISLSIVEGPAQGIKSGGIYVVEVAGSYFLARRYIRTAQAFHRTIFLFTFLVIGLAIFTVPEAVTGIHILQFGGPGMGERRMGLERAFGPFDHPILLGVFCASALSLSWFTLSPDDRISLKRILRSLGIIISAMMCVSSGAVAALGSQITLIGWDRVTRIIRRRWYVFVGLCIAAYFVIALTSNRTPMTVFLYYLTFNRETAYGRITIWDFGTVAVAQHPWFGIGFGSWDHPTWISDSIDNYWLCTTMMYGLPSTILLVGAIIYLIVKLMRLQPRNSFVGQCRKGWLIYFIGLAIAGSTVHFWNATLVLLYFLLGSSVWMLDSPQLSAGMHQK